MNKVDVDVRKTKYVIKGINCRGYGKLYFTANEYLMDIFSYFDFYGKDVLTVLASGDQVFHFYNASARKVDTFDKNKLTIYYFYLRLWTINLVGQFFPPRNFDNNFICELLKMVNPKDEEESNAYNYWLNFIKNYTDSDLLKLFNYAPKKIMNGLDDLTKVREGIKKNDVTFYNIDLSEDVSISKQYDVVYISNITDYVSQSTRTLSIYRDNLERLLKDDGVVIFSSYGGHGMTIKQKMIFDKNFETHRLPCSKLVNTDYFVSSGYYTKKKNY